MSAAKKSTMTGNLVNRARGTITEDTKEAEKMVMDALKSRAYLYPIKGKLSQSPSTSG
jgi:hypothetical protein